MIETLTASQALAPPGGGPATDSRASMTVFRTTLLLFLLPAVCFAGIVGRVVSESGVAIEHARIDVIDQEMVLFTDAEGEFQLHDRELPLSLAITHPRFEPQVVEVDSDPAQPLEVTLVAKQEIYEEIAVSATRGEFNFAPVSVDTTVVDPDDFAAPPSSLTEMVSEVPAVSENGQGGLFQTYSVRGVSRLRVLTLVSGMRINSERRAGVSASFIDPRLMGNVDVVRGPSSTYYGSGALGGVIQLFPRDFDRLAVEAGYASQGDENFQVIGWGDDKWSLGIARRDKDDSETPDGEILNDAFNQISGTIQRRWERGNLLYDVQAIGSRGDDIGKANTDFPERTTIYPEERHGLFRFGVRSTRSWAVGAWAHPNSLQTRIEDPESVNIVDNEALDFGANWIRSFEIRGAESLRLGVDYVARRNVQADELETDLETGETTNQSTLDDGQEDELGLYGAGEWNVGRVVILAGARFAWQRQQNADRPSASDLCSDRIRGTGGTVGCGLRGRLQSRYRTSLSFAQRAFLFRHYRPWRGDREPGVGP